MAPIPHTLAIDSGKGIGARDKGLRDPRDLNEFSREVNFLITQATSPQNLTLPFQPLHLAGAGGEPLCVAVDIFGYFLPDV